jgi:5-methylcytosine-specific restriction endonuclease McrA
MAVKKTIAVLGPDNIYLSHCTFQRALGLMESGRAIRLNATTIRLTQTKRERVKTKHKIIEDAGRVCYICNRVIPEDETATIDHIMPKSRDRRADIPTNMRCCCEHCNNDKGNMTISEYIAHIIKHREQYKYISDKRLTYLKNFAVHYEESYRHAVQSHTDLNTPYVKRRKKKKGKHRW